MGRKWVVGPDNIDIDENGNIWIATHPKDLQADRPCGQTRVAIPQPSRATASRMERSLEEIYVGTGEELSAVSVAAAYNGEMLLGTIFDAKLLRCRLAE